MCFKPGIATTTGTPRSELIREPLDESRGEELLRERLLADVRRRRGRLGRESTFITSGREDLTSAGAPTAKPPEPVSRQRLAEIAGTAKPKTTLLGGF